MGIRITWAGYLPSDHTKTSFATSVPFYPFLVTSMRCIEPDGVALLLLSIVDGALQTDFSVTASDVNAVRMRAVLVPRSNMPVLFWPSCSPIRDSSSKQASYVWPRIPTNSGRSSLSYMVLIDAPPSHSHMCVMTLAAPSLCLLLCSGLLSVAFDHDDTEEGAHDGGTEQDKDDGDADGPDARGEEVLEGVVRVDEGLDGRKVAC